MNNYKHITTSNKPFPDIWTGAWKLKSGIHSSTSCLVSCCLMFTDITLFISPWVRTWRSRVQQTITTTNYYSTVFTKFSPHQYSTRTWQFYKIWKIQHEVNTTRFKGPNILINPQFYGFPVVECIAWFIFISLNIYFGISIHKFKLQLHRAYCWK